MPQDSSNLPLNIDPQTVGRFGAGGALAGGSAAAALALVHMLRRLNAKRESNNEDTDSQPGTIVLTLPNKSAAGVDPEKGISYTSIPKAKKEKNRHAIVNVKGMATAGKRVAKDKPICRTVGSNGKQLRYTDGQFGLKTANWPTLTASLLAAGGGGALGYTIVNKVYEARRLQQEEKKVELAREEYLDMLSKQSAPAFNDHFTLPESKEAQEAQRSFRTVDYPLGLMALATILGAGGAGYLTKRVLDQYNPDEELEPPKPVTRIVFRTAADKQAAADDPDARATFEASLGVYLDICSGTGSVMGSDKIAAAAEKAGTSVAEIYKQAGTDYDRLVATLQGNPDLRNLMQRAAMEQHPIAKYFKWSAKLPGIRGMLDDKLYNKVEESFLAPKTAGAFTPDLQSIVSSYYGSSLAEDADDRGENPGAVESAEDQSDADNLEQMQLVADDPNAEQFLDRNKQIIAKLLKQLAARNRV